MVMGETLPDMLDTVGACFADTSMYFPVSNASLRLEQLAEMSGVFAGGLQKRGVRKGQVVGLVCPTSPDFVLAFFGVLRAGAIPAPLPPPAAFGDTPTYTTHVRRILADGQIEQLVIHASLAPLMAEPWEGICVLSPAEILSEGAPPAVVPMRGTDLALVQYNSGSTAEPKGIALTHANVLAGIQAIARGIQLTSDDVNGQWLPLHLDMGLIGMLTGIAHGVTQYLWPPSAFIRHPARWLAGFARFRATIYGGPNFSYAYLLAHVDRDQLRELDLSAWRIAFNGAEPIDADCVERFIAYFGTAGFKPQTMFPVYGLTEATLTVTFPELGEPPCIQWVDREAIANERRAVPVPREHPHARGMVAVGRAVLGHELRIVGERGQSLSETEVGAIEVRGPAVMSGYYRNPDLTRQVLAGGWLRTGDLGYLSEGRLFITGRTKEMIIVHGVNYYPEDVEALVREMPGVHRDQCVAVTLAGARGEREERMAVLIETQLTEAGQRTRFAETVRSRIATHIGLNHVEIYLLRPDTIRRTASEQSQRRQMRTQLQSNGLGQDLLEAFTE